MVLANCHASTTDHLRSWVTCFNYNLKHDRKKTEELASVGRMTPVEEMVLPDKVTDLPVQGLKQFDGERTDRLNDLTQQQSQREATGVA